MNFLHLHTTDSVGGAAISMYRLHQALRQEGHGSRILAGRKFSADPDCQAIVPERVPRLLNEASGRILNRLGLQAFGFPSTLFLKKSLWLKDWADVLVLRNVHGNYLSLGVLPFLTARVPLIWRIPDMWPVTGHCAYAYDCERWRDGCGRCPNLTEYPALPFDTTARLWQRKRGLYQKILKRTVLVSSSRWLKNMLAQSPLTKDFRSELIPTAVDKDIFSPGLKLESRRILGILPGEKVVMISAVDLRDHRKGAAVKEFLSDWTAKPRADWVCLVLGRVPERFEVPSGIRWVAPGFVADDRFLNACYNAADVYVSLSRADNLPNTLVEAAMCGVPIVTLDRGGCAETIAEGQSGFAVEQVADVLGAVEKILTDLGLALSFGQHARKLAVEKFSMDKQVKAYAALAQSLLKENGKRS